MNGTFYLTQNINRKMEKEIYDLTYDYILVKRVKGKLVRKEKTQHFKTSIPKKDWDKLAKQRLAWLRFLGWEIISLELVREDKI